MAGNNGYSGNFFAAESSASSSSFMQDFESGRIQELKAERLHIQQKTFTKWINSFLNKARLEITNIFTDLSDGRMLIKLLEIISGEKLGKPNAGKLRVHKVENVNKCLAFLHTKVRLESIGAEDIVDGNQRLILGLIWTIILRFQIQEIEIEEADNEESTEKRSAKDALLIWCQRRLRNYRNIYLKDFSTSWRDGMGFCALVHSENPNALDYDSLDPRDHLHNLEHAFKVAEREYGIARLLDPEDVDVSRPDEKIILMYVSSFYHNFSKRNQGHKGAKRINNVIARVCTVQKDQDTYQEDISEFLKWVQDKTEAMRKRDFPNHVEGLQLRLREFNHYHTTEKPARYRRKVEVEARFFSINTKLRQLKQAPFTSNVRLMDLESAWTVLEKEENGLQAAINTALVEQESLLRQAANFFKKSELRKSYIEEMSSVLSDRRYGTNLSQVQASLKKHEAIAADIASRKERLGKLKEMAQTLIERNFYKKEDVQETFEEVVRLWAGLEDLVDQQKKRLTGLHEISMLFTDIDVATEAILRLRTSIGQTGARQEEHDHLDETLQAIHLLETEQRLLKDTVERLRGKVNLHTGEESTPQLEERMVDLERLHREVSALALARRRLLEEEHVMQKLFLDLEEVHLWVYEKLRIIGLDAPSLNLASIQRLQEKQKIQENEMQKWRAKYESLLLLAENVKQSQDPKAKSNLEEKLSTMAKDWTRLADIFKRKNSELQHLNHIAACDSEIHEMESWLNNLMSLASSTDLGSDLTTCTAQIGRLQEAKKMTDSFGRDMSLAEGKCKEVLGNYEKSEYAQQGAAQITEREVPQVKALYPYDGQDVQIKKGEVMFLIAKTNADWWNVKKANGQTGFVPRNYVTDVAPKIILVQTQKGDAATMTEAIRQFNLNGRNDGMKIKYSQLTESLFEREATLSSSRDFFAFRETCDSLLTRMKGQMALIEKNKPSANMEESLHKYEAEIEALTEQSKTLEIIFPAQKRGLQTILSQVVQQWKELHSLQRRVAERIAFTDRSEIIQTEYEETVNWLREKRDAMDVMFSSTSLGSKSAFSSYEPLLTKMELYERELQALQHRVEKVLANLEHVPHLRNNIELLRSEYASLQSEYTSKKAELRHNVDERKFKDAHSQIGNWMAMRHKQIEMEKESIAPERTGALIKEIQEDIKEHAAEMDSMKQEGIGTGREKAVNELLTSNQKMMTSLAQLEQFLREEEARNKVQKEFGAIEALLGKVTSKMVADKVYADVEDALTAEQSVFIDLNTAESRIDHFSALQALPAATANLQDELENKLMKASTQYEDFHRMNVELKSFSDFKLSLEDALEFIRNKDKAAADLGYTSKMQLQNKLKKHDLNEGEVRIYASQIKMLNLVGSKLTKAGNHRTSHINELLGDLNSAWDTLLDNITKKTIFLAKSLEVVNICQKLRNLRLDTEAALSDCKFTPCQNRIDCAKRINSLNNLQSKTMKLKAEQKYLQERVNELEIEDSHKEKSDVSKELVSIEANLKQLDQSLIDNQDKYGKFNSHFNYILDLETEVKWLEEKTATVSTLKTSSVQSVLPNRARNLDEEISNHRPAIEALLSQKVEVLERGQEEQIRSLHTEISQKMRKLNTANTEIAAKVIQAEQTKNILDDLQPIEDWCEQKKVALRTAPFGTDEASVLELLKRHKSLELELDCYKAIVAEGNYQVKQYQSDGSSDSGEKKRISEMAHAVGSDVDIVLAMAKERRAILMSFLQYFEFLRETEDLETWMRANIVSVQHLMDCHSKETLHIETIMHKFNRVNTTTETGKKNMELCEKLAARLEDLSSDVGIIPLDSVRKHKENLKENWNTFITYMNETKELIQSLQKLLAHEEKLLELYDTVESKTTHLSSQHASDSQSLRKMQREYELFQGERSVLASQVSDANTVVNQAKIDYSEQLITSLVALNSRIQEAWSSLENQEQAYQSYLKKSSDYFSFVQMCNELHHWSSQVVLNLPDIRGDYSIAQSQNLRNDLENIKFDVEGKESSFTAVLELAEILKLHSGNEAAMGEEVDRKLQSIMEVRQNLHMTWQERKVHVDQLLDYSFYLRDVRQVGSFYSALELALGSKRPLSDVEDLEEELKAHRICEKNVELHGAKVERLKGQAQKLIGQDHVESKGIKKSLESMDRQIATVGALIEARKVDLHLHIVRKEFLLSSEERIDWLNQKLKVFNESKVSLKSKTFSEQMESLKRYQTFLSDVAYNESAIATILKTGKSLLSSPLTDKSEIEARVSDLDQRWLSFQRVSSGLQLEISALQEKQLIHRDIEDMEGVQRESLFTCQTGDIGTDFEHCKQLERKFNNQLKEQERCLKLLDRTQRSLAQLEDDSFLSGKLSALKASAMQTNAQMNKYRLKLVQASQIHQLNKDIDDNSAAIKDHDNTLQSMKRVPEDGQEDFSLVLKKVREVVGLLRDHQVSKEQLSQAARSLDRNLPLAETTDKKLSTLDAELLMTSKNAEEQLSSVTKHQEGNAIFSQISDHIAHVALLEQKLSNCVANATENEIERALAIVNESEKKSKGIDVETLRSTIEATFSDRASLMTELAVLEARREESLSHCTRALRILSSKEAGYFQSRRVSDLNAWIRSFENTSNLGQLGATTMEAKALVKKVETIQDELLPLKELVGELQEAQHDDDAVDGGEAIWDTSEKLGQIAEAVDKAQSDLTHSLLYHQIFDEIAHVRGVIEEKWQLAIEDSFLDLVNIPLKIEKHQQLEIKTQNELSVMVVDIEEKAVALPSFPTMEELLSHHQVEMRSDLTQLEEQLKLKRERLAHANIAAEFALNATEFLKWTEEAFETLQKEPATDLKNVGMQLRQLQQLGQELPQYQETLDTYINLSENANNENNFLKAQISDKVTTLSQRFSDVCKQHAKRLAIVADNYAFFEFRRDIGMEEFWTKEISKQVASIANVQASGEMLAMESALRKLDLITLEADNRRTVTSKLEKKADVLFKDQTTFAAQIQTLLSDTKANYANLLSNIANTKEYLDHAILLGHFQLHCKEISDWIAEKSSFLEENEQADENIYHECTESVRAFEADLLKQGEHLHGDMSNKFQSLVESCPGDNIEGVRESFNSLQRQFAQLQAEYLRTVQAMSVKLKMISFSQDYDELHDSIQRQLHLASSEDYGKDLIDAQRLIKKFESVLENNERIHVQVNKFLVASQQVDFFGPKVESQLKSMSGLWSDVQELSSARMDALKGAEVIHSYDMTVDELGENINEKVVNLKQLMFIEEDQLEAANSAIKKIHTGVEEIKQEISSTNTNGVHLKASYPAAATHIKEKERHLEETFSVLTSCLLEQSKALSRSNQVSELTSKYKEWMEWIADMISKITSGELASEYNDGLYLLERHGKLRDVIASRDSAFREFETVMSNAAQSLASEQLAQKCRTLQHRKTVLSESWATRAELYKQHLDYLKWKQEISDVEAWLNENEGEVVDSSLGASVVEVERLLSKHCELEESLRHENDRVDKICRLTLIETKLKELRDKEEYNRKMESERLKREANETFRRKETLRATKEKRRADERRRTQEIVLPKDMLASDGRTILNVKKSSSANLPVIKNILMSGPLERKQESEEGGKKAASRSWKPFFVVLSGNQMHFFKEKSDWESAKAQQSIISLLNARAEVPNTYTKRKFVFRVTTSNDAEFLFSVTSGEAQHHWLLALQQDQLEQQQMQKQLESPGAGGGEDSSNGNNGFGESHLPNQQQHSQKDRKGSVLDKFLHRKVKQ